MTRPLIISDCDEVLLHMVVPFRDWLDRAHDLHFDIGKAGFFEAIRHKHDGTVVLSSRIWELLNEFFDTQMDSQYPIDGAIEGLGRLSNDADVVILTNLLDHRAEARAEQLAKYGLRFPVHTNQGPKGAKIADIVAKYRPDQVFFIDDIANHHESALEHVPQSWRLHMVGEPLLAPAIEPAPYAHARIDIWGDAERWISEHMAQDSAAPAMELSANGGNTQCRSKPN